jgi:hypothetical protein
MSAFLATPNSTHQQSVWMVTEECYSCHVLFAMPSDLKERALKDRSISFYCPNGHGQHYIADKIKTLESQLQREREEKQRIDEARRDAVLERDHHWTERKKLRTRHHNLRKRIQSGVCPCCHRTFENVSRHMQSKHPSFDYEPEPLK